MLHSGLVSITFRQFSPRKIIELVSQAQLEGIEWGGDVHVPHGDLDRARQVNRMTEQAGLCCAAYGSYYRAGDGKPFEPILDTAIALGAPWIRVWAGSQGSAQADASYRKAVTDDLHRITELAAHAGVKIAMEYHNNTLTDTPQSTQQLLGDIVHDHLSCYWQPPLGFTTEQCLAGLDIVLDRLAHVHVFAWGVDGERLPLSDHADSWSRYLSRVANAPSCRATLSERPASCEPAGPSERTAPCERFALLEFVRNDQPETFLQDAATLKAWLEPLNRIADSDLGS